MAYSSKNILITGLPGSGKTTLIKKLANELWEYAPAGFYTEEIRRQGTREGFKFTSLDRKLSGVLAHVDIKGPQRVGKYGVDIEMFEYFLGTLPLLQPSLRLVIIDEIGKMECLSARFRSLIEAVLNAPAPVIAAIASKAVGFIYEIKHRQDVYLYEITESNRDALLLDIVSLLRS